MKDFAKVSLPCPWDRITRLRGISTSSNSSKPTKKQTSREDYCSYVTERIGVAAVPSDCPKSIETGAEATVLRPHEPSFWPTYRV